MLNPSCGPIALGKPGLRLKFNITFTIADHFFMKLPVRVLLLVSLALTGGCNSRSIGSWGLPISLGQSSGEVRKTLGSPNGVIDDTLMDSHGKDEADKWRRKNRSVNEEWFHSSGIVASIESNRLFKITLYRHADYRGFLPYAGSIVEGVNLNSSREMIMKKLGNPTKAEENAGVDLQMGKATDPHAAAVFPAQEIYYWRRSEYTIEALFLKQPQLMDEKAQLVLPKGELMYIKVYR